MNSFSIQEAFRYGFEAMKKYLTLFLGLLAAIFVISMLIGMLASGVEESSFLGQAGLGLINFVFDTLVAMSLTYIGLRIFEGKSPSFNDAFAPYGMFLHYFLGSLLFSAMVVIGLILLIVPGIYIAVTYGLFQYILIDQKKGPIESLKESARITKGNKLQLFGFGLVAAILNVLGALLFYVGLVVTIPISVMASIYVYKKLVHLAEQGDSPTEEIREVKEEGEETETEEKVSEEGEDTEETSKTI